ncbi:MAG: hypothetical protein HYX27_03700 [Acidobacteria bacterium]|nr:hypothetical protein [Acidobacteriota bacterium]
MPLRTPVVLHITLIEPPAGVLFALQNKDNVLSSQIMSTGAGIEFEIPIEVDPTGRAFGKFVMGPPAQRFVYINSGTYAGQPNTRWSRRAKIPLANLPVGAHIETKINGRAGDGGPCCATVPLVVPWKARHNIL